MMDMAFDEALAQEMDTTVELNSVCNRCSELQRIFNSEVERFLSARVDPFSSISKEILARVTVDMERAKTDLLDHLEACNNRTQRSVFRAAA